MPSPIPIVAQHASAASRLRRQERFEEAPRLRGAGATMTHISAELGVDRKTVQGWLRR